ncbi:glycoprotein 3-alpha-L-fucosyltransferase A-like isoform X1 [Biomphalaria pfeifferi]|uniref:Fucosyltransferase n=1 Tax=Biomphalaria pfeifferi TaxID=112525 RepID=A0AAD8FEF5_BIOPF|nr:glycoprotein 3-alpha-L-fucosyltransferase A-like isoform X1 [Biomphalaria pfeifferi]
MIFNKVHIKRLHFCLVYLVTLQVIVLIGQRWILRSQDKLVHNRTTVYQKNESVGLLSAQVSSFNWKFTSYRKIMKIMDYNPRPGNHFHFNFQGCEYHRCAQTSDPLEADLLMINGALLKNVSVPKRPAGQIWLMYTREPLTDKRFLELKRPSLRGQFNWTRTYFNDSTFVSFYGGLRARVPPDKNYDKIYQNKQFDVAWFVSHCNTSSRREDYVRRMTSKVNVHIFGKCGNYSCGAKGYGMGGSKDACLNMLSRDYKFYLSFENSFCREYLSEKFFNLFPDTDVIPVVRGGANYTKLLPSGFYINSKDFRSPEHLGNYLHELARDRDKYLTMLKTKTRYEKYHPNDKLSCTLCKAVHTQTPQHSYEDVYSWLTRPDNCWPPDDLG